MFAAALILATSPLISAESPVTSNPDVITFNPPKLTTVNDNNWKNTFEFIPTKPGTVYLEGPPSILFSQCAFVINSSDVGKRVSVSVGGVPVDGDAKKPASVNIKARLYEKDTCAPHNSNYKIKRIMGKCTTCTSMGDPHFVSSYGSKFSKQDQGYFTLFNSKHLTVQVFQQKINGKAAVNKAVAVRYGNEVFVLDLRGGIPKTVSKVYGKGKAQHVKYTPPTKNEQKHKFYFTPCSTVITLNVNTNNSPHIGITINAAAPYSAAGIDGICGSKNAPKNLTPFTVPDATNIFLHPKEAAQALSISESLNGLVNCAIPSSTDACDPQSTSTVTESPTLPTYIPSPPLPSVSSSSVAPTSSSLPSDYTETVINQCTKVMQAAKCGSLVDIGFYIESCISDCQGMESLAPVESIKNQLITDCKTKTESEKCNPDLVKVTEVSKIEKELGLDHYECPEKCSNNGQCTSAGCVCNAGYSGLNCAIDLKSLAQPSYSDYSEPVVYPSSAPLYGYTQQLGQVQNYNMTTSSPSYPPEDGYEEPEIDASDTMYSHASPILPSLVSLSMFLFAAMM